MVTIDVEGSRLVILGGSPKGRDEVHGVVSKWPGWRRHPFPQNGVSVYKAQIHPSTIAAVDSSAIEIQWSPLAARVRDSELLLSEGAKKALRTTVGPLFTPPTARRPMPHQWQAIQAAKFMGLRCLIADDMGLGKTSTALWCLHKVEEQRVLIVCPASVKFNWQSEIEKTLGPSWRSFVIDGTKKRRANVFADLKGFMADGEKVAAIINYDLLRHCLPQQMLILDDVARGATLICDESHYLKSRAAERTKLVRPIADLAQSVLLLSGTPIRNTVEDLFSQIDLIRPGTWTSYADFANRHLVIQSVQFHPKGRPTKVTRGSKNVDALNAIVNTLQIRRRKEDVLDLPPKIHTFPQLTLDPTTAKIYKAMREFARLELTTLLADGGAPTVFDPRAQSAVEAFMRCEQICQGFVGGIPAPIMGQIGDLVHRSAAKIDGRPNELVFPKSAKIQWLLEAISDVLAQGGRPVVFSRFNAPMFWLVQHLNREDIRAACMHGAMSSTGKRDVVDAFQEGELKVLAIQVAMAEGFNLTNSQDVLFLGRDWSPARNSQAEDRCYRIGQKGTVNVQVPIVGGTVETSIHRKLAAKAGEAAAALKTVNDLLEAL